MPAGPPNIIFVMLDTARADYFGSYGGRLRLDNIDGIWKNGVVYENAISPGTYTLPSHVSLFLGKQVSRIPGLMEDKMKHYDRNTDPFLLRSRVIKPGSMTLAKRLSYLGYGTAIFSNNPLVSEYTGIAEGFSYRSYTDSIAIASANKMNRIVIRGPLSLVGNGALRKGLVNLAYLVTRAMPAGTLDAVYLGLRERLNRIYADEARYNDIDQGARDTNRRVEAYCNDADGRRNFMFINYMEAHEGYPTSAVTDTRVEQDKWLYMSGIADASGVLDIIKEARDRRLLYLDRQIGRLMSILKSCGMLDNAVLIFGGDHGQGFMEHGQMYHGVLPYNEIVHVPLVCTRFVNGHQVRAGERVARPVSLTALHDAVLDIGYGAYDAIDGNLKRDRFVFSEHTGITEVWDTHLLRLIRGRSRYADAIYRAKLRQNAFATAVYCGRYKLIHYKDRKKTDELYNIHEDERELENLIFKERDVARRLLGSISG
jgi:hypothetical protein